MMKAIDVAVNKIHYLILTALFLVSCHPPDVGYLSNNIHALEDTVVVPRGTFITSASPNIEGSTYPMHWEITQVTNDAGESTDALFEKHDIVTWTEAFNPNTDTTLALAKEKIEISAEPSLKINDASGELIFTQASKFVKGNDIFKVNVEASNVKGEKKLDDFYTVKLQKFQPVEFPTEMRSRLQLGTNDGEWDNAYTSVIQNGDDEDVPSILNGTHPYFSIQKVKDEPSQGIKVKMIITDSHDQSLDPDKVVFYPSGASYLQNYHDNSTETTTDETGTTFSLPAPPFPQYARNYSGSSSYLMYYLTTTDAFTVDTTRYENEQGSVDWSKYRDPETHEVRNRAYIRWAIKINDTGTWHIKMRIPYTTIR